MPSRHSPLRSLCLDSPPPLRRQGPLRGSLAKTQVGTRRQGLQRLHEWRAEGHAGSSKAGGRTQEQLCVRSVAVVDGIVLGVPALHVNRSRVAFHSLSVVERPFSLEALVPLLLFRGAENVGTPSEANAGYLHKGRRTQQRYAEADASRAAPAASGRGSQASTGWSKRSTLRASASSSGVRSALSAIIAA